MLSEEDRTWLREWKTPVVDPYGVPITRGAFARLCDCVSALGDEVAELHGNRIRDITEEDLGTKISPASQPKDPLRCPHGWQRHELAGRKEGGGWRHVAGSMNDTWDGRTFTDGEFAPCGCHLSAEGASSVGDAWKDLLEGKL